MRNLNFRGFRKAKISKDNVLENTSEFIVRNDQVNTQSDLNLFDRSMMLWLH